MDLSEKIAKMSPESLDRSIQTAVNNILAGEASSLADAKLLAELVQEQTKRQRVARARIGEYFRQRAMREEERTSVVRGEKPKGPDDLIDSVHADRYGYRVALRYSDIEMLAPALERDTKAEFEAEQKRRLAAVLEANPKLTDKQRAVLEHVVDVESRVHRDLQYGASYGGLDGRTVKGLLKRGLLEDRAYGGAFDRSSILIIAKPSA